MPRTINPQEHAEKRRDILEAAQRLIYEKGYERMTIQDLLLSLNISSGAFYHYFDSKPAVLAAFVEQRQAEAAAQLLTLVDNPRLAAIEKLAAFFGALDQLRSGQKTTIATLLHVWYADENAIVRQKVEAATRKQRAPMLTTIVQQGLVEGAFCYPHPEQSGEVIAALLQGMEYAHAELLLTPEQDHDDEQRIEAIVGVHAAYMEAIERVLGATPGALPRSNAEVARAWLAVMRVEPASAT